jgi:hypothetical protein
MPQQPEDSRPYLQNYSANDNERECEVRWARRTILDGVWSMGSITAEGVASSLRGRLIVSERAAR